MLRPIYEEHGSPILRVPGPATGIRPLAPHYDPWDQSDRHEGYPAWLTTAFCRAYRLIGFREGNGEWITDYELTTRAREYQEVALEIIDSYLLNHC
jgi:hypothetical protein